MALPRRTAKSDSSPGIYRFIATSSITADGNCPNPMTSTNRAQVLPGQPTLVKNLTRVKGSF